MHPSHRVLSPHAYAGTNLGEVMYDYDKMKTAWRKMLHDFSDADTYVPPALVPPGRALEAIDYKLYKWPGHGLSKTTLSYQAVEGEWMKPNEYDALIRDPSDFWLRTYLPRVFGAFKAFGALPPWTSFEEIATTGFLAFGNPEVQAGFNAIMEAGTESLKWITAVGEVAAEVDGDGLPGDYERIGESPVRYPGRYAARHAGRDDGYVPASAKAPRSDGKISSPSSSRELSER